MIVVDASFALNLVLNQPTSPAVSAQWQGWYESGELIIAPPLFQAETLSVVRRHVHRGALTDADGERALVDLDNLQIGIREPMGLYRAAWDLAKQYNRPTIYDCCYLALGAMTGCELWTADQRLANAVRPRIAWVRTL